MSWSRSRMLASERLQRDGGKHGLEGNGWRQTIDAGRWECRMDRAEALNGRPII